VLYQRTEHGLSWLSNIYLRNLSQIKHPLSSERVKRKLRAEYARTDIVMKTSLKIDKRIDRQYYRRGHEDGKKPTHKDASWVH